MPISQLLRKISHGLEWSLTIWTNIKTIRIDCDTDLLYHIRQLLANHRLLPESKVGMPRREESRPHKENCRKLSDLDTMSSMQKNTETIEAKRSRRRRFIAVGVVIIVIFGILTVSFYQNYISPFNRTIITVDNLQISMRYFLDRTRLAGSDPLTMLETLTNELVMRITAPKYGIQVTDADIENELRNMASGGTGNVSDVEFNEWYRQVLNDNKASDSQYREIVGINLLSRRLQEYLAERVPTAMEQVHLHVIAVQSFEEAQDVLVRLEAGEDFATLAREVSIETASKDGGGDLGWLPPAISNYAEQITALEINEISPIIPYYSRISMPTSSTEPDACYVFMVSEKDSSRPLTEEHRKALQTWALDLWLVEEIPHHNITYNFNSENYAWLNKQLERR